MNSASKKQLALAYKDIKLSILNWRIWLALAWQDIRLRYRRSQLGPFWISLSMAVTIYSMGFLYGHLFKLELHDYYPFLAAGMLSWSLILTLVTEGINTFIEADGYLKQIKIPYYTFILRVAARSFIIFFHNIIVLIPIIIIMRVPINWHTLLVLPALALIFLNALCYISILAAFGTRYRDVGQIITSLMQVVFFTTPIMWQANILPTKYQILVNINPFAQLVELIRAPLLGNIPSMHTIIMIGIITTIGIVVSSYTFYKLRSRIIYWL